MAKLLKRLRRERSDPLVAAAMERARKAEASAEAWRARFWEAYSGGRLVPSDEDRRKHDALIGPMPPPFFDDAVTPASDGRTGD